MKWNLLTAQNLAIIDQEVNRGKFSPAEYEIVRRTIYVSGDFDYHSLVSFSSNALQSGAAALSARVPIIVDTSILQTSITSLLQSTFLNPVYSVEAISSNIVFEQKPSSILENLAYRYPYAIYVFGQNQIILDSLLDFIESQEIKPSLIITTASGFIYKEAINMKLRDSSISHIRVDSCKGGVNLAMAIIDGLIDLAWMAKQLTIN
ncbi:cobalt-precorrin-8x methylmutase [Geminocystis sp. NIES-3708]|uniref:precorrin-8X methylmutase n=1 Tax=Geminocystis sp. NIES-3708 TaxID=1615909 RepID=UPI0005FCA483|nr:precorrin-8X methylmutase [Geminocystis sp. NIES-3708]BAQ60944.1 cobalt-precorrin-8x methylmutase [Geminocystis sp. NIES-3708]